MCKRRRRRRRSSTSLCPNLGTRAGVVTIAIRSIIELIRPNTILTLFSIASRLERTDRSGRDSGEKTNVMIVIIRVRDRHHGDGGHFGAENAKNIDLFLNEQ